MGKKILVVDDEEDILTTLRARLEHQGYAVVIAHDGLEGLQVIEEEKPDLIILDVMMENMGGYEMLQAFKKKSRQQNVRKVKPPFIVLTAKGEGVRDLFEMQGVSDYVVKPFESKELLEKIDHALSS